jgi:ubiquinone/menaquinone biosynthesis C-methylase UbiE
MVFDVQKPWPFEDNQAREIYASHMLEHLSDFMAFFREAWRVLEPNGNMCLRVPHGGHRLAWSDPTHLRPWFAESFCFLQPGYGKEVRNPQETAWGYHFGVHAVQVRVAAKFAPIMRHKWLRKPLIRWLDNIANSAEEVYAYLYAIKTPDAVEEFMQRRIPYSLPARYAMYKHHLEGRKELREGEPATLVDLDEFMASHGFDNNPV